MRAESVGTSIGRESEYVNGNHDEEIIPDDAATPAGDNFLDDSDNSEDLDDLDIFMRNNNSDNRSYLHYPDYGSDYHSSGHQDWNSCSFSQSYDDFHDE